MSEYGLRPSTEYLKTFFNNKPIICAELGVFKGWNTERMLNNLNIIEMHLIDVWITPDDLKNRYNYEDFYTNVCQRFEDDNNIKIYREDTVKSANNFKDKYFDFVYIDADHSYLGCKKDISAWWPKIKKGGILCGHDYYCCDGVKKSVDEFFKNNKDVTYFDAIGMYDNVKYGEWLVIK